MFSLQPGKKEKKEKPPEKEAKVKDPAQVLDLETILSKLVYLLK